MDFLMIIPDKTKIIIEKIESEDYRISYSEIFGNLTEQDFSNYMENTAKYTQYIFGQNDITSDVLTSFDAKNKTYTTEFFCKHEHIDIVLKMFSVHFKFIEHMKNLNKNNVTMSIDEIVDIFEELMRG